MWIAGEIISIGLGHDFETSLKNHYKKIFTEHTYFLNKYFYIVDINDKDCKNNEQMKSFCSETQSTGEETHLTSQNNYN